MWHGILETYKRAPSPSLLHKDMNLVYKAARDFITADVDRVLDRRRGGVPQGPRLPATARAAVPRSRRVLQLRPHALRRLTRSTTSCRSCMKPKINLPSGGVDRHRVDRSVDGHRRQLRQVHRRTQPRGHDRQDEHRGGGGDRAPGSTARHRRHHRRRFHRHVVGSVAQQSRSRRSRTACAAIARARRSSRFRTSGCSSSRASASAGISGSSCAARARRAAAWAA